MESNYFVYIPEDAQEVIICDEAVLQNKVPGMEFNVSFHGIDIHTGKRFDFLHEDSAITFTLVRTDTKPHEPYHLGDDLIDHG